MSDPTKYVPGYSYSGWQATNPSKPLPAGQVDNDFAKIKITTDQTIDALADIRRSDGELNNGIVTIDSLDPEVAGLISDAASGAEVPIYATAVGLASVNVPEGTNFIRTNGYYAADGKGAAGYRLKAAAEANEPGQQLSNGGKKRWALTGSALSVLAFGAVGDGVTDDAATIQAGLSWLLLGSVRTIIFDADRSFSMASGVTADFTGHSVACNIIMYGSIKPNAGIGRAITIKNSINGNYTIRVEGGGQTADYTQANPFGGDEAFTFINGKGNALQVWGRNYAGRVLRITADGDATKFQGQLYDIDLYVDSSAAVNEAEAIRLAAGVGQGFYVDINASAFGRLRRTICFWEKYGSIMRNTSDVTHDYMETLYRGLTGFVLEGPISYWGGSLNVGSEMGVGAPDLVTIKSSAERPPQNIHIKHMFTIGGTKNVVLENIGTVSGQGIKIGYLNSRSALSHGIYLNNTRKFDIGFESYADQVGMEMTGTCNVGDVRAKIASPKAQAIILGSGVTDTKFIGGGAYNGNISATAGISLIDVNSTGSGIKFADFTASSGAVDYLYDVAAGGGTQIVGGSVTITGGTLILNNQPQRAMNVVGWTTANMGAVTLAGGTTSVVASHGLVKTPDTTHLTPRGAEMMMVSVSAKDATTLTIKVSPAPVASANIDWTAKANYAGA